MHAWLEHTPLIWIQKFPYAPKSIISKGTCTHSNQKLYSAKITIVAYSEDLQIQVPERGSQQDTNARITKKQGVCGTNKKEIGDFKENSSMKFLTI